MLLLDEPLAYLDPLVSDWVTGELMAEATESDVTVMLSTHIVAELSGVGDHLLLLDAGRPVLAGDVEQMLAFHRRLIGPRADRPRSPGTIVQLPQAERQSAFVVGLADAPVAPAFVAPPPSGAVAVRRRPQKPVRRLAVPGLGDAAAGGRPLLVGGRSRTRRGHQAYAPRRARRPGGPRRPGRRSSSYATSTSTR